MSDIVSKAQNIDPEDKTNEFLESFTKDVEQSIQKIENDLTKIDSDYKDLIGFLGDTPKEMPMDTLLIDILAKFGKNLSVTYFIIFN